MKLHRVFAFLLAVMLVMSYNFPMTTVNAEALSETPENYSAVSDNEASAQETDVVSDDKSDASDDKGSVQEADAVSDDKSDVSEDEGSEPEPDSVSENTSGISSDMGQPALLSDTQILDEKPMFSASVEKIFSGYVVKGCFTDFMPDTVSARPQYSLDGETWQDCDDAWNLSCLGDPDFLYSLQNQICLYESFEPLKSYLAGEVDHFYLRLSIARENGITYETQAALIERGEPTPIPEEITYTAGFASSMMYRKTDSSGSRIYCGKYQLTVNASASSSDITALLPDTIPLQVDFHKEGELFAGCTVDCPVIWKPLSCTGLTAGENMIIQDAAEEIAIPAGTPLCTPMGTFTLEEPLGIESEWWMSDEVVLILNVVPDNEKPTGVLSGSIHGLEMAFDRKPTGATAIRAYTLTDGDSEWRELTGLSLLDAVNAQPSTASSGYTTILSRDQEPFRSYLAAEYAGEEPTPFLVGLTIEGGIYNGCQLILAYPDTYTFLPDLRVGGAGGNQGNAGTGNRDDSTEEGQRPHLPQNPEDEIAEPFSEMPVQDTTGDSGNPTEDPGNLQQADSSPILTGNTANKPTGAADASTDITGNKKTNVSDTSTDTNGNRLTGAADASTDTNGNKKTGVSDTSTDTSEIRKTGDADTSTDTSRNKLTGAADTSADITANRQAQRMLQQILPSICVPMHRIRKQVLCSLSSLCQQPR